MEGQPIRILMDFMSTTVLCGVAIRVVVPRLGRQPGPEVFPDLL